jgi:hypothetical protein
MVLAFQKRVWAERGSLLKTKERSRRAASFELHGRIINEGNERSVNKIRRNCLFDVST